MASPTRALSPHEAYMERMKADFDNPRYNWVIKLLSKSACYKPKAKDSSCQRILDFDGTAPPKEVLRADMSSNLQDGVCEALESNLSPTATRVVLLHYPGTKFLNFEYVRVIGHALDLEPRFFITHFQEGCNVRLGRRCSSSLQLSPSYLQFRLTGNAYLTACVLQDVCRVLYYLVEPSILYELTALSFDSVSDER
jgi:hypothetical protein